MNNSWVQVSDKQPETCDGFNNYDEFLVTVVTTIYYSDGENMTIDPAVIIANRMKDYATEDYIWSTDYDNIEGKFIINDEGDFEVSKVIAWMAVPDPFRWRA